MKVIHSFLFPYIVFHINIVCLFQDCLSPLSMQALPAAPESLCIVEMGGTEAKEETGEAGTAGGLFLNTGLQVIVFVLCFTLSTVMLDTETIW